jgi:hypothetical protein
VGKLMDVAIRIDRANDGDRQHKERTDRKGMYDCHRFPFAGRVEEFPENPEKS